eukprot:tig00021035_g17265.t1
MISLTHCSRAAAAHAPLFVIRNSNARARDRFAADALARAGEFAFVARRCPTAEDDGYLVGYVHDEGADRSELRVFDAAALGDPLARVLLPQRVPYGFHGAFFPV